MTKRENALLLFRYASVALLGGVCGISLLSDSNTVASFSQAWPLKAFVGAGLTTTAMSFYDLAERSADVGSFLSVGPRNRVVNWLKRNCRNHSHKV